MNALCYCSDQISSEKRKSGSQMDRSQLVRQMNQHLGAALKLIEDGAAKNNAQIRNEMSQFFQQAELIEREIAKNEVLSLNSVKNRELNAVREQIYAVNEYLASFDKQVEMIKGRILGALEQTAPLLDMTP